MVRATSANYSRLVEMVNPYNRSLALPWVTGAWDTRNGRRAGQASKEIGRQAAMLGYINAFGFYTLCSALAIPLILLVGRRARARWERPERIRRHEPSACMISPNSSHVWPLKRCSCTAWIG